MNGERTANGRFGTGNKAATARKWGPVRKAATAAGLDGVVTFGGRLMTGETDAALTGRRKWVEYANTYTRPPVAVALLLRDALLTGVKWTLRENKAGGKPAQRGMDLVEQGMLDARLRTPWSRMVARGLNGKYFEGISLHSFGLGRRKDGLVVLSDVKNLPPSTFNKWNRPNSRGPFESIEQLTTTGEQATVYLDECLYLVNQPVGNSPEGVGVLRFLVDRIRKLKRYEQLEGSELFGSMGGTPIARVPLGEINAAAKGDEAARAAFKQAATANIEQIVSDRIKTPEEQQYIVLSSETYEGTDPNTISTIKKWDVEIIKADLQGVTEIRKVISDDDLNLARMLHVEFAFVGGGDTRGTFGMHESKVTAFVRVLQTDLDGVAIAGRDQVARQIVAANGEEPDIATPDLVPEEITTGAVLDAAQLLVYESQAGAHPEDEAWDVLREREGLPPRPKLEIMAGMGAPRRPPVDDTPTKDGVEPPPEPDPTAKRRRRS